MSAAASAPWDEVVVDQHGEIEEVELDTTALTLAGPQVVQTPELDIARLCKIAQGMGPRDRNALIRQATEVGRTLGGQLKPDGTSVCFYSWEQGGTVISGPTVDLMEALADLWTRLIMSVDIVEETARRVRLVGSVMDLVTLIVKRRPYLATITPPSGKYRKSADQADRWVAQQLSSASSKAIRGALEHTIPEWMQSPAVDAAKVAYAKAVLGDASLSDTIAKAVAHLAEKWKIDETALVAWLEVPRASWRIEHVAQLRALATELKDGKRTVADFLAEAAAPSEGAAASGAGAEGGSRLDGLGTLGKGPSPASNTPPAATPTPTPTATGASPNANQGTVGGGAPAAGTGSGTSTEPAAGQPAAAKPRNPNDGNDASDDAAKLHAVLGGVEGFKAPIPLDTAGKAKLREALGYRKLSDERYHAAIEAGVTGGRWHLNQGSIWPGRAAGRPAGPEPLVIPDPWTGPVDQELSTAILKLADAIGEAAADRALIRAGFGGDSLPSSVDDRRRCYVALRDEEAALKAEAARTEGGAQ